MVSPRSDTPRAGSWAPAQPVFPTGDRLVVAAPAKLNLFLEVHGRRPDGYHELRSVMWAIDLADRVA